jgi:Cof subfamily protein (haloacid dehalogenase superfamily)
MDIDGTLLDSTGHLPEANRSAIAEAAARGVEIMIVTGRRYHSARMIAASLPCNVELIASNGALIKSMNGETHYRHLLPVATARKVLDATTEFRSCAGVIFDRPHKGQIVFERIDWDGPFIGPYLRRHREQVEEIDPLTDCLDGEDPVEVMFIGDFDLMRNAIRTIEALPMTNSFTLAVTEYEKRGLSMFDVLAPGISKGAALREWATRRGIAREEIMAVGDNWNDREMLEYAGLPVIMGNAVPELKSLGWEVTLSNDEAGLAETIRKHVLVDR